MVHPSIKRAPLRHGLPKLLWGKKKSLLKLTEHCWKEIKQWLLSKPPHPTSVMDHKFLWLNKQIPISISITIFISKIFPKAFRENLKLWQQCGYTYECIPTFGHKVYENNQVSLVRKNIDQNLWKRCTTCVTDLCKVLQEILHTHLWGLPWFAKCAINIFSVHLLPLISIHLMMFNDSISSCMYLPNTKLLPGLCRHGNTWPYSLMTP